MSPILVKEWLYFQNLCTSYPLVSSYSNSKKNYVLFLVKLLSYVLGSFESGTNVDDCFLFLKSFHSLCAPQCMKPVKTFQPLQFQQPTFTSQFHCNAIPSANSLFGNVSFMDVWGRRLLLQKRVKVVKHVQHEPHHFSEFSDDDDCAHSHSNKSCNRRKKGPHTARLSPVLLLSSLHRILPPPICLIHFPILYQSGFPEKVCLAEKWETIITTIALIGMQENVHADESRYQEKNDFLQTTLRVSGADETREVGRNKRIFFCFTLCSLRVCLWLTQRKVLHPTEKNLGRSN